MLATLNLVRWPLGVAQVELWRAWRHRRVFEEATFFSVLLPIALRYMPLGIPDLRAFGYFATWPSPESRDRFRASPLARRWASAESHLDLTLAPIQGFGSWRGMEPLAGWRTEPMPGPALLLTHSRTRPAAFLRFSRRSGAVANTLPEQSGHIWADGFMDRVATLDTGTLSLWGDLTDATGFAYGEGVHRDAVRVEREGHWFAESWFGRFVVADASGSWPRLDLDRLSAAGGAPQGASPETLAK